MNELYSKEVMKRFQHPKNVGEIKNPDGVGKVGNPRCGDLMWVYIKVGRKNGKEIIKSIKVKTFGCVAAIASSDMLCEIAKGKSLDEALKIKKDDIIKRLGRLPLLKIHCSVLAQEALQKAIEDYKKKGKK